MYHEFPAEVAEEYWNSIPEPGQVIWFGDEEYIVLSVSICNNSKLEMKTYPKKDIKYYDNPTDFNSLEFSEFSEEFLESENEKFLDNNSLNYD